MPPQVVLAIDMLYRPNGSAGDGVEERHVLGIGYFGLTDVERLCNRPDTARVKSADVASVGRVSQIADRDGGSGHRMNVAVRAERRQKHGNKAG